MSVFKSHPGKAIWTLFAILINIAKFPWAIIYYIPRSNRPHIGWSLRQAASIYVLKRALWHMSFVNMQTPLSLLPQGERDRWAVVKPAAKKFYLSPTDVDPLIKPTDLGVTWYPKSAKVAKPTGKVVLHFHGGAYMIGDGRTRDAGFAAKTMLKECDVSAVFAPQYRLSGNANSHFPAALQDAITAYVHLIKEEGIEAKRIIISGDSAGANLSLALVRYLTENKDQLDLELPLCAWLWSPWVSPARSLTPTAFDESPNAGTDYVTAPFGYWGAVAYHPRPSTGLNLDHPLICFYNNVFATPVPLYVSTGECEVLFHDDVKLAEELKAVKGNQVRLQIEEQSVHDIILIGKVVGFEKEAARAAKRANGFLQTVINGGVI